MNPKEQRTHRTVTADLAARAAADERRLEAVERASAETLRLQTKTRADLAQARKDIGEDFDALETDFHAFRHAGLFDRLAWLILGRTR